MPRITETPLPGVGVRLDFESRTGPCVGVIARTSGRRELLVYDVDDPDAVRAQVDLSAEDAIALAEALGAGGVSEQLDRLPSLIAGLAIDWLPLPADVPTRTIGELELRRRTGASVVAIVRGEDAHPAPGPEDALAPGDTVVMVGTAEGLRAASELLGI